MVPEIYDLSDAIAFACEENIALASEKATVFLEEGLHQQKRGSD